jgi:hypothetical protein
MAQLAQVAPFVYAVASEETKDALTVASRQFRRSFLCFVRFVSSW